MYLLNDLKCYGKSLAGIHGSSSLYLQVDPKQKGYSERFLLSMLHQQFSSILMHNCQSQFPEQEWRLINAKDFRYTDNELDVVEQDSMRQQTTALWEAGFLDRFGTTSLVTDFSLFAGLLLTRETELCKLRKTHPRINQKAHLAIEFYKDIGSEVVFSDCKLLASTKIEELK